MGPFYTPLRLGFGSACFVYGNAANEQIDQATRVFEGATANLTKAMNI